MLEAAAGAEAGTCRAPHVSGNEGVEREGAAEQQEAAEQRADGQEQDGERHAHGEGEAVDHLEQRDEEVVGLAELGARRLRAAPDKVQDGGGHKQ